MPRSASITATASDITKGELAGTAAAPGPNMSGKTGPSDAHFVDSAARAAPAVLVALGVASGMAVYLL
ncbi:hypothetical protein MVES1_003658 [Malassezia vespertilionis]|uniref:uncharacterized protein n=1 Tax=Malassezia vespertilionis TaxID=2020962 RepID=UPI0024B0A4E6|nr:uncharacterized protein MVES1_003658 [Malassezia vespertilionis]WFD08286.1 hypothetical protein MVES1_003658 [Malassezia vespertilionis]